MPDGRSLTVLEKVPVPEPIGTEVPPDSAGEVVFQTIPRAVTGAPPFAVTSPPKVADVSAILVAGSAVTTGSVAASVVKLLSGVE